MEFIKRFGMTFTRAIKPLERRERQSLSRDLQTLQTVLEQAGVAVVAPIGYEADDLIATFNALAKQEECLIYSGDRDLFQLVSPTTTVLYPSSRKGAILTVKPEQVQNLMNVRASQVIDYKALKGDSTDNIPGIKGMGDKTALALLARYDSVEDIYTHIGEITGRPYTLLKKGEPEARLSKMLATLVADIPLSSITLQQFDLRNFDVEAMVVTLNSLGLATIAQSYQHQLNRNF